jgi:uncharacterized protein
MGMRMNWKRPLFVHLEVPRAAVAARVPAGLTLEGEGDLATVSLVALHAEGPAPALVTRSPLHRLVRYVQLNLRTYVTGTQGPGLLFFDARVDHLLPVASRVLGWPYRRDEELAYVADDSAVALKARDISVKGLPAPGEPSELAPDHPERARLDRFVSYGVLPGGLPYAVRVSHAPWRIRPVEIDPDSKVQLGDLGEARFVSAQLAESVDVSFEPALPVREQHGGLRGLVERAALSLVQATP